MGWGGGHGPYAEVVLQRHEEAALTPLRHAEVGRLQEKVIDCVQNIADALGCPLQTRHVLAPALGIHGIGRQHVRHGQLELDEPHVVREGGPQEALDVLDHHRAGPTSRTARNTSGKRLRSSL
jgi:hypothetical protein